jgi:hypothetical protein
VLGALLLVLLPELALPVLEQLLVLLLGPCWDSGWLQGLLE